MKKVALVFVIAVLAPSLVLAWLALRSQRDQQFIIERQQSLLYQRVTDAVAASVSDYLTREQQAFGTLTENLVGTNTARSMSSQFDNNLRKNWPLAEVGFCVSLNGELISPSPKAGPTAQRFLLDNSGFLSSRESAEVYWNVKNTGGNANQVAVNMNADLASSSLNSVYANSTRQQLVQSKVASQRENPEQQRQAFSNTKSANTLRNVEPQGGNYYSQAANESLPQQDLNVSKLVPAEAEFRQLVGNESDGMLARFLQNKLKLMFWHRLKQQPDLVFGAQLNLTRVIAGLSDYIQADPELRDEICIVLLDDNAKPVKISREGFQTNWKRPFVATEIGEALPHWEVAAYLVNPAQLTQAARTARITIGLFVAVLLFAIGVGSWLIVRNLNAELRLARQKTDFVSNVSHELKTPLTSIRMFSELLADGRVTEVAKQKSYLNIISAEAARLTRLINNVLDFSRMESGEKKYNFQPCDLNDIVRSTAETFRPHLEAGGFKFDCSPAETNIPVNGDSDALSQIIVNLLSNAEKYSNGGKEIVLQVVQKQSPLPHVEINVLDRGLGIPRGSESKIFEKFYRAHDSLSSGIQGSGLGLTIARQIARAHGGDVTCEAREGGGSCFTLRLPLSGERK